MTWIPPANWTERQIEKELNRQKVLFDEKCKSGQPREKIKFEDFIRKWFEEYAEAKLKKQTIDEYRGESTRVIKKLGHLYIDKISVRDIQKFITELGKIKREDGKGEGLSPKSIKNHLSFISTVFNYAIKQEYVQANPCKNVTLPKLVQKEKEFYTIEEINEMLPLLEEQTTENFQYAMLMILLIYTGCRRGEILGLEWADIDFDNQTIDINKASYYSRGYGTFTDTPKSKTSYRCLKIPVEVAELLKRYRIWQKEYSDSIENLWVNTNRLFTSLSGTPMNPDAPLKYLKRFCQKYGFRVLNLHSFRHAHASLLINQGVDVKSVQTSLGHSSATTTLNN